MIPALLYVLDVPVVILILLYVLSKFNIYYFFPHICLFLCALIWFLFAVIAVDLKQTVHVDKDLQIRAYYAGHVRLLKFIYRLYFLLAAMFHFQLDLLAFSLKTSKNVL